uniref:Uncharacterized protein n=1 Tax=Streptomyces avermitilis TaxID=33903 RepID=A0A499W220_STRAX|nr:hypothetical protein SAVMC3_72980 [Streptomyces avermitilis]
MLEGDGARRQLEEGEHLRHRGDDLGDGGVLVLLGFRVGERPGVEKGDPAAQYGAVVAVPRAQPPAGAGTVAVHLDEAREACGVPVGTDLSRGQAQIGGGPFGGGVGEGAPAVGGPYAVPRAERGVGPAGDTGRVGEAGACHAGQFRGRRGALRRPGCRAARAALGHRSGGCGQGPRADESEPGVARVTGRHGCSLPVDGPKTQTECHGGRQGWPMDRSGQALETGEGALGETRTGSGFAPLRGAVGGVPTSRG